MWPSVADRSRPLIFSAPAPCHGNHGISSNVLNAPSFAGDGKGEMSPINIFTFVGLDIHPSHTSIFLFNERHHQYCPCRL